MKNDQISWGETWPFVITTRSTAPQKATLSINQVDGTFSYEKSAFFTDGMADVSYNPEETELELGNYSYQLRIDYTTGQVDKFPDLKDCEDPDNFVFPILTITEALDRPGVA